MEHLLRATARAEARHFWFRGLRAFVTPLVRQATAGRPSPRILDCGCGTGTNLHLLGRYGTASGFDLSPVGLRFGREAGRRRLARASITAIPFRSETFDLVTSFDVLYSLGTADEQAAIEEMYRITRPGGHLIVNVAAMEILRGNHSVLSRERRRYSRASLARLVTGAGFEIVRLTYTNVTLFLPLLLVRTRHRRRGLAREEALEAQREISVPPSPMNAALTALLYLESLVARHWDLPAGSSLLCLARKPAVPSALRT
jgi:SAM-dependent methyltransferase